MEIKRLSCPSCHFTDFDHDPAGNLVCKACGTLIDAPRAEITCRVCGTVNPGVARRCMNCGSNLGRVCAYCDHFNPPGSDHCLECGEPLDTLSAAATRTTEGQRAAVARRRDRLVQSKTEDAAFMQAERERLNAEYIAQMERLRQQQAESRRQQTVMLSVMFGVGAVVLLCLLVLFVVFSL
ncbi:MAG: hypothetical protein GYB64_14915 [Chloroflexi bacterium]|nr:hypothetical protein [Chloroflexota bacterium]